LRLVLSLGQGIPHCAAFPATARVAGRYRPTTPTGWMWASTMGRGATALSATGTGAVDLETKPSHGPDGCDFVTSPVAPPRRSSPAPTRGHERACRRPDDGPPESAYGPGMGIVSPGFSGRGRSLPTCLPGSTSARTSRSFPPARRPRRGRRLRFTITTETGAVHDWDWSAFRALATESPTVDLHCVTRVVEAGHVVGGRLTGHAPGRGRDRRRLRVGGLLRRIHNEPALEDLLDGKAWVAFRNDAEET
jgi:hypothetical protein